MTDEDILKFLWPNKICLYKGKLKNGLISNIMLEYLKNRFQDSDSIEESLYRLKYGIYEKPKCERCGKPTKFSLLKNHGHFNKFCSRACQIDNDKIKKAVKEKYGVDNISQLDSVKKKVKNTNIKRYGVENVFNTPERIQKSINTRKENKESWINKIKETNLIKYGVDNPAKSECIQEKIKNTNIKRYGQNSWAQTKKGRKFLSNLISSNEVQEKINNTKRKNNSFNKSTPEDESYELLKEKFNEVIRQYHSVEYPYNCDFYIPSIDTYIECNYFWTHGFRPYIGTEEDLNKIKYWKNKHTKFYDNAIKTWTYYDLNKRNIAKENKLNWFEFFYIKDLKDWITKYEK